MNLFLTILISALSIINTTGDTDVEKAAFIAAENLGITASITIIDTPNHRTARNYVTEFNGEYFIFIDASQNTRKKIQVLAHELIHVKQYQSGQLVAIDSDIVEWMGKEYSLQVTPHYQRPWEVIANREGRQLVRTITSIKNK